MDVQRVFESYRKDGVQQMPAAVLTLCEVLLQIPTRQQADVFGHELCMGIRRGLFGDSAMDSLHRVLPDTSAELSEIAAAIRQAADK